MLRRTCHGEWSIQVLAQCVASLVADGVHYHIERACIYAAIAFSVTVETLNLVAAARRKRAAEGRDGEGV